MQLSSNSCQRKPPGGRNTLPPGELKNWKNKGVLSVLKPEFPRGDLHVHTLYSDGCTLLPTLVHAALQKGLSVVAKTDHNTCRGNGQLRDLCQEKGILFLPGIEISTKEGHLVALGIEHWMRGRFDAEETAEKVHELGGVAVMAHPFEPKGMKDRVLTKKNLDAFELLNGAFPRQNLKILRRSAEILQKARVAVMVGGDSHAGISYGEYVNEFKCDFSADDVLEAIRKKKVKYRAPLFPIRSWLADGAPNQLYQLRRLLLFRRSRPHSEYINNRM